MRQILNRDMFLAASQATEIVREDVPLPEFGEGAVIPVWGMTAGERTRFERQFATRDGKSIEARVQEFRERLLVACCRDDAGIPIFKAEDVQALGRKRADIVERIVNVAQRLSGFTQQDIEQTVGN